MQKFSSLITKIIKLLFTIISIKFDNFWTYFKFYTNNIQFQKFHTNGIPFVMVARGGYCKLGNNLKINNGLKGNPIGRPQPCIFFVDKDASLIIGNNVGISSVALISHKSISIGDNVKIGGGVCIYDTDFHSLNPQNRLDYLLDKMGTKRIPIKIGNNVFIGAHSTILKGVTIGDNTIVGACSVVTKSIPDNEIWAGNPAQFIKKIIH
jgi:acetyltransferase-like isoleucine patch superfamily enzyme